MQGMNSGQFRKAMEDFGISRNIPKRDILMTIDQVGIESLTYPDYEKPAFFERSYLMFCMGFPEPLPVGTKSLYEQEDSD